MKHIGIVACSAEGASLCYRTLAEHEPAPHITMHTPPIAEYVAYLDAGDVDGVAALMLDSAERLARAGAELLICPDNTIHQAMSRVVPRSPLPWLHIADVVAEEAVRRGFKRVGVLGTRWLVNSDVYPEKFSAQGMVCVKPSEADRNLVHHIIMGELVLGKCASESTDKMRQVIARLRADGCDAVALVCTELPIVLNDANSPLPTLDSTRLLAQAALSYDD